jgi:hypothetical protein
MFTTMEKRPTAVIAENSFKVFVVHLNTTVKPVSELPIRGLVGLRYWCHGLPWWLSIHMVSMQRLIDVA